MSKNNSIFSIFFVLLLVVAVSFLFSSVFTNQTSRVISKNPIQKYDERLLWQSFVTKSDAKGIFVFSTEIPFPGPYCDCYDSTGGLDGIAINQVSGGYFEYWQGEGPQKWQIVSAIIDPNKSLTNSMWGIPGGDFYTFFQSKKVGESFSYSNVDNKEILLQRLPDKNIEGTKITLFESKDATHKKNIAVFQRNGYRGFLSFETFSNGSTYDNAFMHMIETLTFKEKNDKDPSLVKEEFINQ